MITRSAPKQDGAVSEPTGASALAPRVRFFQRVLVWMRSSLVGLLATASDLGTLAILIHAFDLTEKAANLPSLVPGLVVQFLGNKYFAFDDRSKALVKQTSLFLLIEIVAFGLNALLFHLLVSLTPLHFILARLAGTNIVYLGFSLPMWSIFVFRLGAR